MRSLPFVLLLLAFAGSGAAAQTEQAAPQTTTAQATDDDDDEIVVEGEVPKEKRRVCEMRTTTGSIRPRRVCRTIAQIEEDERAAREAMDSVNRDRETRDAIQLNRQTGG